MMNQGKGCWKIKRCPQTGSNDVYVVKMKIRKDILIPALKSVVKDVSIENKKIVVKFTRRAG